ncbi:hypothetical protein METBIDRAFT_18199, partial [Metschnikowia bicuspidata var. bicuspidata NRRL YB-4993]
NIIQTIQPAQATRLLEALKEELAKAKAAGPDTARARQHYARAEQIKQVLVNYRQQQQQRQAAAARANTTGASTAGSRPGATGFASGANTVGNTGAIGGPAGGLGQNTGASAPGAGTIASQQQQQQQQQQRSGIYASSQMPGGLSDAGASQQRPPSVAPGVTTEKYNQVRTRLQDLERKIRTLEAGKRPDMGADENTQFDNQLRELKLKYAQYSKFALYMKNQLLEQARSGAATAPMGTSPAGTKPGTPAVPPAAHTAHSAGTPGQSMHTPADHSQAADHAAKSASAGAAPGVKAASRGPSPSAKEPSVPGVNLSLITKPSVPSIPISSTINVKPHNPITLKPGANNVRPTLTAGGSSGLGQVVNSPAMMRMPTFDMASTGPIQDNGGRVLTKRKLTELVNTIGADEGDGKTTIDGDVEELLLDLADEFVSSVTTFACRLAKHRKTDAIDVRDVQLHLERNWNIRIPGHAMDEIRSMRKWQPNSSYTQKVSGVDIVKAVNGPLN